MTRAADYGQPTVRVRRVTEGGRGLLRRARDEVELTEIGATEPSWTRQTSTPVSLLRQYLGLADAHAVVTGADEKGPGRWLSLFDEDAG